MWVDPDTGEIGHLPQRAERQSSTSSCEEVDEVAFRSSQHTPQHHSTTLAPPLGAASAQSSSHPRHDVRTNDADGPYLSNDRMGTNRAMMSTTRGYPSARDHWQNAPDSVVQSTSRNVGVGQVTGPRSTAAPSRVYAPWEQQPAAVGRVGDGGGRDGGGGDGTSSGGALIREGFLCPDCSAQMTSASELRRHYNSLHLNAGPGMAVTASSSRSRDAASASSLPHAYDAPAARAKTDADGWELLYPDMMSGVRDGQPAATTPRSDRHIGSDEGNDAIARGVDALASKGAASPMTSRAAAPSIGGQIKGFFGSILPQLRVSSAPVAPVAAAAHHKTGGDTSGRLEGAASTAIISDSVDKSSALAPLSVMPSTHVDQHASSPPHAHRLTPRFIELRSNAVVYARRERTRLLVRAQKLATAYEDASTLAISLNQSRVEQAVVPWEQHEFSSGLCDNCLGSLATRGREHCRLCGRVTCAECLCVVPLRVFLETVRPHGSSARTNLGVAGVITPSLVADVSVLVCSGQCLTVASARPVGDPDAVTEKLVALHTTLRAVMTNFAQCAAKTDSGGLAASASDKAEMAHLKDRMLSIYSEMARLPLKLPGNQRLLQSIKLAVTTLILDVAAKQR